MTRRPAAALVLAVLLTGSCSRPAEKPGPAGATDKRIKIGFSMDTLKEERWHRDRDLLVKRAGELGAEVLVQAANGNDALQNSQAENMLTQGVDVLLVAPHNGKTAAVIVEAAHRAGVPVIAYDRLINDADVDLYISFDNERVGQMQAEYLVKRRPKGNYVLIGGAPTDNNALLYHQGQMKVLEPYVARGDIHIVSDQWARDWLAVEALKIMENALTRSDNKVDAVVAANDGVAGGAIQALTEQKLAGVTLVSGPGRGALGLPARRGRHAEHDGLQADRAAGVQGGRGGREARQEAAAGRDDPRHRQRQDRRAEHPPRADRGRQGQPGVHRHRRRLPEARGRLPRRPEGPLAEGTTLVLSKRHVPFWHDLTAREAADVFALAHRVARKLKTAFDPEFVCLMARGRRIPHTHVFLVPTAPGDVLDRYFNGLEKVQEGSEELAPLREVASRETAARRVRAAGAAQRGQSQQSGSRRTRNPKSE